MSQTADSSVVEHLISVAGEIFAAKGTSATVREICGAAGCSVAAINYHFGDKQRLYLRCIQAACEQKQQLFPLPKPDGKTEPETVLRQFIRAMAARIAGQTNLPWQNTLMLREVLEPSEEIAELLASNFRPDFDSLERTFGNLLGSELDSLALRRQLSRQVLARCMFLRTGKRLREILSIDDEISESPERYADEICDSLLLQIATIRASWQAPRKRASSIGNSQGN